ncbi:MAG TPA: rod shape-determining protein [Candidatus Binatia bacterium]
MGAWKFFKYFCDPDVAIDLGTANTRLYVLDRGLVAEEPTRVSAGGGSWFDARAEHDAAPLKGGVVNDIDATARLLGRLLQRIHRLGLIKPRALVCAPSDASREERFKLVEAVRRTGISKVQVLPEPLASAVGAGIDITLPYGQMLVDIGDGVTDVAVIRSRKLILTRAVRLAVSDLRWALQRMVKEQKNLFLPAVEADRLVREHGALGDACRRPNMPAVAFDRRAAPTRVELRCEEVFAAMAPVLGEIVDTVCRAMADLPTESAVEVAESGVCLCGGGAYLRGIDRLIARRTSIEVKIIADPMRATIAGAGEILAVARQAELWETGWSSSPGFGE